MYRNNGNKADVVVVAFVGYHFYLQICVKFSLFELCSLVFARICIETSINKRMFRLLFCSYVNTYKVPSRGFSWNVPFPITLILLPSRYLEEQTIVKRT